MHAAAPRAALLAGLALLLLGCPSGRRVEAPTAHAPNILFAIADDVSYPHMGAYGTDWTVTPAFDRVAREGLLFTRAYTPNAKCAPSRAIILTGRNSWQLEEAANHVPFFPAKFTTYVEALGRHGYHVGFTGKGWAPGVANDAQGNARQLTGRRYSELQLDPPAAHISTTDYAANFERFLDDRDPNAPFAFWYGALEPHRAYDFDAGRRVGGKSLAELGPVPAFWPAIDSVRIDLLDYAFEIEHFDRHLGRMLALLEERGELDNTLVVVTADNGMPFPRAKGQAYAWSNHMPLAIRWPEGIAASGRTVEHFVSFADFAPTFLEVAGLDPERAGMQPVTGRSLSDVFSNAPVEGRDYVLVGKERHDVGRPHDAGYPIRGIVEAGWLYVRNYEPARWPSGNPETGYLNTDGSPTKTAVLDRRLDPGPRDTWALTFGRRPPEELYDLTADPYCVANLAADPAHAARKTAMAARMEAQLRAEGDPRMEGRGHVFDDYPYAQAANRGFYERFMRGDSVRAGWVNASDFEPAPLD